MRPGHHRPLGTVARSWFVAADFERPPELGDLAVEASGPGAGDEREVDRAYLVVGIEEGRTRVTLLLERVEYGTLPDPPDPDRIWSFYRLKR